MSVLLLSSASKIVNASCPGTVTAAVVVAVDSVDGGGGGDCCGFLGAAASIGVNADVCCRH